MLADTFDQPYAIGPVHEFVVGGKPKRATACDADTPSG
jgi:hypothetical protein